MINEKINFRNKIILSILSLLIIFITCLSISYAYFSATDTTEERTITTGNISLIFDDNTNIIRNENIYPITRNQVLTLGTKKSFTITNTSDSDIYSILTLEDMKLPPELRNVDFNWALYQNDIIQTTGSFNISMSSTKIYLTNYELVEKNKSKTYDLYIWIEESGVPQDSMQGKIFNGKIVVNGLTTLAENDIPTVIKNSNNNLFTTNTINNKTTYYYKGNVTNNYLSFAGNLWRIVRINEDNSIRIILETDIGQKKYINDEACTINNQTTCTTNYLNSNLKISLDKWYENTIKINSNLDNKVVLDKFCNDTSNTFSDRISNPTFDCSNIIESKIGTISADEIVYSGDLTYLNNNTSFYTMTSSSNSQVYSWNSNNTSVTGDANVFDYYNVRPVINLDSNVIIASGDGTINNPYIVN